jgi:hypothetical protein
MQGPVSDDCHNEHGHNDGAENDFPMVGVNPRYRFFSAEPIHDFVPAATQTAALGKFMISPPRSGEE